MMKLKVGIAGYGIVGKRRHKCIDHNPSLELTAICDRNSYEAYDLPDDVEYFNKYTELLDESLDVLIVCMTNDMAAEVTIAGLQKGMHVFCEKPPGRDVEDIINVLNVEKNFPKAKLMYGFNHRHHGSIKDALAIVQSNEMGKVINMRGVYGKSKIINFDQSSWRTQRHISGGGILLDQGIHMVDLMRLFGGEFYDVKSFVSNNYWGYDVEDNAYAIMRSDQGIIATLSSSATQWRHQFSLEINLDLGSLILRGILSGSKSYGSEQLTIIKVDHRNSNGDPQRDLTSYKNDLSWQDGIDLFTKSIINDEKIDSGSSQDALHAMQLVFRIYYADPEWRMEHGIQNPDN